MSNASSIPSNLSDPRYGYDFIVALTQESINATMLSFLSQLQEPIVEICYIADNTGNPVQIDAATLKANANGSDPFSIPSNADVGTNPDIQNLVGARFMMGFRAQIGLPHVRDPTSLGDVVVLGTNSSSVVFNLYCSTFTVVQYSPSNGWGSSASWLSVSQDPSSPWVFTSTVDLRLEDVDGTKYDTLPANVQRQISNLGSSAFSVQQLLFDLANAKLESIPTMSSNIIPGTPLYNVLEETFLGAYFAEMQAESQPLLGCNIVTSGTPISTLQPTSLNLMVNPYLDPNGVQVGGSLTTLNYLCQVGGDTLPPSTNFTWNWVPDEASNEQYDGIVSINRSWFVNYFKGVLTPYVQENCLAPSVQVVSNGLKVEYSYSLTPDQAPTITTPDTGSTVLTYNYTSTASDRAGLNGDLGSMTLQNTYTMSVQFTSENTIIITQHQIIYTKITLEANSGDGNIVDKTITDTYTLLVDEFGNLQAQQDLPSQTVDNSKNPKTNGFLNFFDNVDSMMSLVEGYVRLFTSTALNIPVATAQSFVFPGGKTFLFKGVGFSAYQDLVAFISYADVSGSSGDGVTKVVTK